MTASKCASRSRPTDSGAWGDTDMGNGKSQDDNEMTDTPLRLTGLSHGGGCGCKIAPGVLTEMLARMPAAQPFANLLVGTETADDAAVWRLNDTQALIATTDFFMPIVDDPFDFGRIAATNAISDVYAMGGHPLFALALVGMPVDKLPVETIRRIVEPTQRLVDVCAKYRKPVLLTSTSEVYGISDRLPFREEDRRVGASHNLAVLGKRAFKGGGDGRAIRLLDCELDLLLARFHLENLLEPDPAIRRIRQADLKVSRIGEWRLHLEPPRDRLPWSKRFPALRRDGRLPRRRLHAEAVIPEILHTLAAVDD